MILLHGFLIVQHMCDLIGFDLIMIRGVHLPFSPNGFLRNQTHILAYKEAFLLGKTRMKIAPFLTWTHSLKALNSASHMPLDTSVYDLLIHFPYATDWFTPPHIDYISHCLFCLEKWRRGGSGRGNGGTEGVPAQHTIWRHWQVSSVVACP